MPQSLAGRSGVSNVQLVAPTDPKAKKQALDVCDAEDSIPGKRVWTFIDLKSL